MIFYCQQQAIYICVFSAFLAADAIHNERKSRRILLVLSKAVSRGEYLLAVILGTCTMAVAYAMVFGLCGIWLTARAELPSGQLWSVVMLVIAGSVIAATVAMFFSTFLNPYVATAITLLMFCAPGAVHAQRHAWSIWLPGISDPDGNHEIQFSDRLDRALECAASGCRSGSGVLAGCGSRLQPQRHRRPCRVTAAACHQEWAVPNRFRADRACGSVFACSFSAERRIARTRSSISP